jgi:hypothetical protein
MDLGVLLRTLLYFDRGQGAEDLAILHPCHIGLHYNYNFLQGSSHLASKYVTTQPVTSQLPPRKVRNHLSRGDPSHSPQRRDIQCARQAIGEAKAQHGRNPSPRVLKSEASTFHLVLLDGVCKLSPFQDVEVVIGGVAACVAFCAYRSA